MKASNSGTFTAELKEIFSLFFHGKFRALLFSPTKSGLLQFCRYCLVGGIATIADWGSLYAAERAGMHYLAAAVVGFIFGLLCNYLLSKFMVFHAETAKFTPLRELLAYAAIGAAGLLLTLGLMYVMTDLLGVHFMLSKCFATVLVLLWNFLARKRLLY